MQNTKSMIQNSRQSNYIDKLHHKREIALERMHSPNI